jgi:hypothetical protein
MPSFSKLSFFTMALSIPVALTQLSADESTLATIYKTLRVASPASLCDGVSVKCAEFSSASESSVKRVISIDWSNRGWNGTIPAEIGNLTELTSLILSNNNFSGSIPSTIQNLKKLRYLAINNNKFNALPEFWDSIPAKTKTFLPNPIKVSQPIAAKASIFSFNPEDFTNFIIQATALNGTQINTRLVKRQIATTGGALTPAELYALCPLNDVTSNIAAGCIAGIYMNYCYQLPATSTAYSQCHSIYNQVFELSIFKPLGDVCPAWRQGPRSAACASAISTFNVNLGYIVVNSAMASNLVTTIFRSTTYAPCINVGSITCRWT